jgi:hypothetical protein
MVSPPFSFAVAQNICENYQSLIGSPYEEGSSAIIDAVIVSPFDNINKSRFIMLYLVLNDAIEALSSDSTTDQYDVLVLSGSIHDNRLQYKSIRHTLDLIQVRMEQIA